MALWTEKDDRSMEIKDKKPEPEKEAECKSTQASRATSFMLTCASPNMPCGDYFPAASNGTRPLLSLLLALPCFFPHPWLQSEYICLCPLDFRLSLRLFDKLHRQNFRGSLLMRGLCHISRLLQLWYSCEIAQLFLMRYIWETYFKCVTKQP